MWSIITALVSAFAASGLTTYFSLWRFGKERWWDKTFESYAEIMEALHNMVVGFDEEIEGIREIPEERIKEFNEKYKLGQMTIYKYIAIGEFLLSTDTVRALQKMLRDLDDAGPSNESSQAIWQCLEQIRTIARRDLKRTIPAWKNFKLWRLG